MDRGTPKLPCLRSSLNHHLVGSSSFRVGRRRLASELLFSLLVAVRDQAVQEASWLSSIVALFLGIIGFFGDIVDGFFVGRIVFVEVGILIFMAESPLELGSNAVHVGQVKDRRITFGTA